MIKKIFFTDIKNLTKSFFAMVIVIGVCILPALYAWLNIYSNNDPYGSTGNLKVAAISLDKGFTDDNNKKVNVGDTVIENLHDNTAINWQFVTSEKEAIEGEAGMKSTNTKIEAVRTIVETRKNQFDTIRRYISKSPVSISGNVREAADTVDNDLITSLTGMLKSYPDMMSLGRDKLIKSRKNIVKMQKRIRKIREGS
ncbi:MAG: hypothetical protein K5669_09270, partial [Lachnospiraceae bacterium]|nr:hypothetical protein [Lachnospiraceae bacterium]